jgi:NAD(P)-dependent dehydrogenase (short-subunit alcohol dehydrogenase family)
MSKTLDGKIAVVTGGSAGIGLSAAKRLASDGARVFISGRDRGNLDRAAAEIGNGAVGIQGDASVLADIDRIYETVKAQAGRIDILLVNAGFYEFQRMGEITEAHFDKTFDTNVRGLVFAVQKALPLLSRGASVILTGSIAGYMGIETMSIYSASKAAVRSLARSWILDLKGRGVRINVVSPGHTETPGLAVLLDEEARAGLVGKIPLGRLGAADDIAGAVAFLASDDSAYITGIDLTVDGGVAQY